jgi:hypothetical protein
MRKEGDRLIITPIRRNRLLELLASWQPLDEDLPPVEDCPPQTREAFSRPVHRRACALSRHDAGDAQQA